MITILVYQGNMGHKQDFNAPVSGFLSVYD